MSEENKEVEVQEQPKKKKSHKGAIIAWSIIGGLVIVTGGAMLLLLNNMKNSAPTAKIQGKTFHADTSEKAIRVFRDTFEVNDNVRAMVLNFVKEESEEDPEAKVIQEAIDKYGGDTYKNKFKDTTIEVSSTSLFSYNLVDVTLKGSDGSEWYKYSLESNSDKKSLKQHLNGDEKEQQSKLYTKTGVQGGVVQLFNTVSTGQLDVYVPYGTFRCQLGTAFFENNKYSIQFRIDYN